MGCRIGSGSQLSLLFMLLDLGAARGLLMFWIWALPVARGLLPPEGPCTTIVAGRKATTFGTAVTHTADCFDCDFRLAKVRGRSHSPNATRDIPLVAMNFPADIRGDRAKTWAWRDSELPKAVIRTQESNPRFGPACGAIPEAPKTYALLEALYGIQNEKGVAMGESTCGGVFLAAPLNFGGKAKYDVTVLSRIALERCATARCAIQLMGDLAVADGFYGAVYDSPNPGDNYNEAGEAMTVIDPEEAWVFHILADDTGASALWAAQRVPDDGLAVVANAFVIRGVPPPTHIKHHKDEFMGSPNLYSVARIATRGSCFLTNRRGRRSSATLSILTFSSSSFHRRHCLVERR